MTIYVTPFTDQPRGCTGASTDSGFPSLDAVAEAMGEPFRRYPSMLIYGEGNDRVVFTRFIFCIDGGGNSA